MASVCAWLGGGANLPLLLIGLPILGGLIIWLLKKTYALQVAAVVFFGLFNMFLCLALYLGGGVSVSNGSSPVAAIRPMRAAPKPPP